MLAAHPDVAQSVVSLREDRPGDKRLVAYCVPAPGTTVQVSVLREHLRQRLPDYMVPAAFVPLERLPLTVSGKRSRWRLPAPASERPEQPAGYIAPRNAVERTLAGIWGEVLGVTPVGIHDNFFELGGHSLSATVIVARASAALQQDLPLRRLFDYPTIAALAEALGQQGLETSRLERQNGQRPLIVLRQGSVESLRVRSARCGVSANADQGPNATLSRSLDLLRETREVTGENRGRDLHGVLRSVSTPSSDAMTAESAIPRKRPESTTPAR